MNQSFPRTPGKHNRSSADPDLQAPDPARALRRGEDRRPASRLITAVQSAVGELGALLIPVECVCCEVEDVVLCTGCARRLRQLCKVPFRAEQEAPALVNVDGTVKLGVVAAGPYRDELAQCLLSFKHFGQWRLAAVLATCLRTAVKTAIGGRPGYCLIPVPTTGSAYRKRGFSPLHLLLLVMRLRRLLPGCPPLDVLEKRRMAPSLRRASVAARDWLIGLCDAALGRDTAGRGGGQKGLGRGERANRVRGSMRIRPHRSKQIRGRRCLIVDDVLTTGATLAEAARAVTAAGGIVCGAVVLAATRPPAYASSAAGDDPREVVKTQSKNKRPKDE